MSEHYDALYQNSPYGIVVEPDGQIYAPDYKYKQIDIVPGSFNPLHNAHKALYWTIDSKIKMFEISVYRYKKEPLYYSELMERIAQFAWYAPVMITNVWRMEDKAILTKSQMVSFHVGFDTATRLLETETKEWLDSTPIRFHISQREKEGKIKSYYDLPWIPKCFVQAFLPGNLESLSSTDIRNGPIV